MQIRLRLKRPTRHRDESEREREREATTMNHVNDEKRKEGGEGEGPEEQRQRGKRKSERGKRGKRCTAEERKEEKKRKKERKKERRQRRMRMKRRSGTNVKLNRGERGGWRWRKREMKRSDRGSSATCDWSRPFRQNCRHDRHVSSASRMNLAAGTLHHPMIYTLDPLSEAKSLSSCISSSFLFLPLVFTFFLDTRQRVPLVGR